MIKKYLKNEKEKDMLVNQTAARYNEGKIRYELIPAFALEQLALAYTYGAQKYSDDNWRKGFSWRKTIGSLLRHVYKWARGEKLDDESNCHHLAMAAWNAFTLLMFEKSSVGIDDRHPIDLDLIDKKERDARLLIWNKLMLENKLDEYNGLDVKKGEENA